MDTPRGTKDYSGEDLRKILEIENLSRQFFVSMGFEEIRTPIIEFEEVFRKVGETSDIVLHQLYSFTDKDGRNIVLRPEGTAPAVRFLIKSGLDYAKIFYIGPMFRRERPQKGRLRQFHQIGCEIFGSDSTLCDAYIIFIAHELFKKFGIESRIEINYIGCKICRTNYYEYLRKTLKKEYLCEDCKIRYERNPLRILDCKIEKIEVEPITNFLCENCYQKMKSIKDRINEFGIKFYENPFLVRGLDYYTGFVFEIFADDKNALGAGGRYDNLVESMGGKPTPAIGFAIGVERVAEILKKKKEEEEQKKSKKIFIAYTNVEYGIKIFKMLKEKFPIEMDLRERSLKSQMRYADKISADIVIIVGEEEMRNGFLTVRYMNEGRQEKTPFENLETILKKLELKTNK